MAWESGTERLELFVRVVLEVVVVVVTEKILWLLSLLFKWWSRLNEEDDDEVELSISFIEYLWLGEGRIPWLLLLLDVKG